MEKGGFIKSTLLLVSSAALALVLYCHYKLKQEPTPLLIEALRRKDQALVEEIEPRIKLNEGEYYPVDNTILFGKAYKNEILAAAKKYNVPPEIILAVFNPEINAQSGFTKLTDDVGTFLGLNVSIGLGQVRIRTAEKLDEYFKEGMTKDERIKFLNTPEGAIEYIAKYMRYAIDQKGMDPANELIFYPDKLAKLYAYYVGGLEPNEKACLNGFGILNTFQNLNFLELFGWLSKDEISLIHITNRLFSIEIMGYTLRKTDQLYGSALSNGLEYTSILHPSVRVEDAIKQAMDKISWVRDLNSKDEKIVQRGLNNKNFKEFREELNKKLRKVNGSTDAYPKQLQPQKPVLKKIFSK